MSLAMVDKLFDSGAVADDIAPFGWFGIDVEVGDGKSVPLWEVRMAPQQSDSERRAQKREEHRQRVARYAAIAAANPEIVEAEGEVGDAPSLFFGADESPDEWGDFFGGMTPTQKMELLSDD